MKFLFSLLLLFSNTYLYSQTVLGCIDPQATNYNALATLNDGSCLYTNLTINNITSFVLEPLLHESSGLAFYDGFLYTHNDDSQRKIFKLDTLNGVLLDSIEIPNVVNKDWEDLQVANNHFYVGDFGNNNAGNRNDLRIFKWHCNALGSSNFNIDTIHFEYQDQTIFSPINANTTAFDCEAFIVVDDSIYLFTKRWNDYKTYLYAIPNQAGTHIAQLRDSLNVTGLITGASYDSISKNIVLSGYTIMLQPFVYLLYDYPSRHFFKGNKRKIALQLNMHQVEAIATKGGLKYYLTNEYTQYFQSPANDAKMHILDLSNYLNWNTYLGDLKEIEKLPIKIYPNPTTDFIHFNEEINSAKIIDMQGKIVKQISSKTSQISLQDLTKGIYLLYYNEGVKAEYIIKN